MTTGGAPRARSRWQGSAGLPATTLEAIMGDGAPLELTVERVLGSDHVVFARRPRTLREMLGAQARVTPDLPLLVSPERQWTYRQALAHIDGVAALLRERYGVRAGDRVAILAANRAEHAILMWATVTAGAIVTSLNGRWTRPELDCGARLTAPRLVAGDARRLARVAGGSLPEGVTVRLLNDLCAEARGFAGAAPPFADIDEDSPAVSWLARIIHDGPLSVLGS